MIDEELHNENEPKLGTEIFTDENTHNINNILDILTRLKSIGWKGFIDGIFKLIVLVVAFMFIKFCINPRKTIEYLVDLQETIQTEQHTDLMNKRIANSPVIDSYLNLIRKECGVSRAFVVEFHNGNNNFAGLPFFWGDMTYESFNEDVYGVKDNWYNISLTRYNFINAAFRCAYFIGDIDAIKAIDNKFAYKLLEDDITFLAIIPLYDENFRVIGAYGISEYNGRPEKTDNELIDILTRYRSQLNPLFLTK